MNKPVKPVDPNEKVEMTGVKLDIQSFLGGLIIILICGTILVQMAKYEVNLLYFIAPLIGIFIGINVIKKSEKVATLA